MASILFPNAVLLRTPKMHVTTGRLQPYIDPKQAPTKRPPWRQVSETPFAKAAVLTMPSKLFDTIWPKIATRRGRCRYAQVILKLEDILTGDFFNDYVKTGNVLMISEGVPGVDDLYTLRDGVLRLDLGKDTYQRAGLQGVVLKNHGGRKHSKERYLIEVNLRSTSMVRGKKGFERLLYAAKNALNHSRTWLFRDLMVKTTQGMTPTSTSATAATAATKETQRVTREGTQPKQPKSESGGPIFKHHPQILEDEPDIHEAENAIIPALLSNNTYFPAVSVRPAPEDHAIYYEIAEWLSLVNLQSPRIHMDDEPDPYISRYTVPFIDKEVETPHDNEDVDNMLSSSDSTQQPTKLKVIRWTGLMDSQWIVNLLIEIIKQTRSFDCQQWLALTVTAHPTEVLGQINGYTVLLQPDSGTKAVTKEEAEAEEEGHLEDDNNDDIHPPDAMDLDIDTDVKVNTAQPSSIHDTNSPPSSTKPSPAGLQRFTCFQFVDS